MHRRKFLVTTTAVAGAVVLSGSLSDTNAQNAAKTTMNFLPPPQTFHENGMVYRMLGSTGQKVSAIGLGGFHLSKPKTDEEAVKLITR